ncbi:MAG: RidA family protein [Microbacterium sp.]|uniref:RidA family protein n=1 Tax=Microbacterium sp. TaxID=51671 RepID=UPI0039E32170
MARITKVKTGNPFEEKGSYSRIVVVDDWILVSNTAGRNPETKELPADPAGQVHQIFANLKVALAGVGASLADVVRSRVFIPDPANVEVVMPVIAEYFRGIDPATTITATPLAHTTYHVEIELTALRGAGDSEQERIVVPMF